LENTKYEYRNSKQIRISNDPNLKSFEHLPCGILPRKAAKGGIPQGENLGFRYCFGFRVLIEPKI
jgi:hypothetical protein